MSRLPALVLLNRAARHGAGGARWARVKPVVDERLDAVVARLDGAGGWREEVAAAVASGVRVFVAAGGDGTVHALAAELVEAAGRYGLPLDALTLGAVGLGSSNDFHKPVRERVGGIPVRLDVSSARPRDLGRVRWRTAGGPQRRSVLVVSGSAGVVAEGNALFASSRLGRRLPGAAIAAAALGAIARHRDFRARLLHDGQVDDVLVSSLSVLKTPWLSGALRFDVPVEADDGLLAVGLCEGMGKGRLVATLAALARGRFRGRARTSSFRTAALEVVAAAPFLLEVDGELEEAEEVRFDLFPGRIRACA